MEGHLLFNKAVTKRINPVPQVHANGHYRQQRAGKQGATVSRGRLCVQRCQWRETTHWRCSTLSPRAALPTLNITVTFLLPTTNWKQSAIQQTVERHPKGTVLPKA